MIKFRQKIYAAQQQVQYNSRPMAQKAQESVNLANQQIASRTQQVQSQIQQAQMNRQNRMQQGQGYGQVGEVDMSQRNYSNSQRVINPSPAFTPTSNSSNPQKTPPNLGTQQSSKVNTPVVASPSVSPVRRDLINPIKNNPWSTVKSLLPKNPMVRENFKFHESQLGKVRSNPGASVNRSISNAIRYPGKPLVSLGQALIKMPYVASQAALSGVGHPEVGPMASMATGAVGLGLAHSGNYINQATMDNKFLGNLADKYETNVAPKVENLVNKTGKVGKAAVTLGYNIAYGGARNTISKVLSPIQNKYVQGFRGILRSSAFPKITPTITQWMEAVGQ